MKQFTIFQNQSKYDKGVVVIGTLYSNELDKEVAWDLCNYECSSAIKTYLNDKPAYQNGKTYFVPTSNARGYCNADIIIMDGIKFHVALNEGWSETEDFAKAIETASRIF